LNVWGLGFGWWLWVGVLVFEFGGVRGLKLGSWGSGVRVGGFGVIRV